MATLLKRWRAFSLNNEIVYLFLRAPAAQIAGLVAVVIIASTMAAPLVAPTNPFDLSTFTILDSFLPPVWTGEGDPRFLLGTDDQGRDLLSAILYGARLSILVGGASIVFAVVVGVGLGAMAGYFGGWLDALIMRIADVQLSLPAIMTALLIDGVARGILPAARHDDLMFYVLVAAIGLSLWVNFARTARASTLVERGKEYVQAAEILGVNRFRIILTHILPNIRGPIMVIMTVDLAVAVLLEATLSFLGVGVPASQPSLGTLIRIGNDYVFSGEWWVVAFPALTLIILIISVNIVGDFLRDALNPKLR
ncbi:MAG: ABC transporter permease [Alphaproteobacteria bacterium]